MIPKIIFTCWINHDPNSMPYLIKECIESQKIKGYEHKVITIDDCNIGSRYVDECLSRKDTKGYVKASDYVRVWYVWKYGGLHLDGDMEVLEGKNFDHLLNYKMFIPRDPHDHFGNAGFGAEPNDLILKYYLDRIENNFRGDGELVYEPGVRGFSDCFYMCDTSHVTFLSPDYFFPMNRHSRQDDLMTENTLVKHWYNDSWIDKR